MNIPQVKLELAIGKNEEVTFYRVGEASLYLSGYYIPDDDDTLESANQRQEKGTDQTETKENTEANDEIELNDGVIIVDTQRASGGKKAKNGDTVTIHFENRLDACYDSVVGRNNYGDGLTFTLGDYDDVQTIRAWHIGIIGMRKNGKRTIKCPPVKREHLVYLTVKREHLVYREIQRSSAQLLF